jgi:hypothetical protein
LLGEAAPVATLALLLPAAVLLTRRGVTVSGSDTSSGCGDPVPTAAALAARVSRTSPFAAALAARAALAAAKAAAGVMEPALLAAPAGRVPDAAAAAAPPRVRSCTLVMHSAAASALSRSLKGLRLRRQRLQYSSGTCRLVQPPSPPSYPMVSTAAC